MNDLISRKAAIKVVIQGEIYGVGWSIEKLEALPSAQPQRKAGKWISNGVEAFGVVEYWVCDQCHDQSKYRTNYCPNCGARMELTEERSND